MIYITFWLLWQALSPILNNDQSYRKHESVWSLGSLLTPARISHQLESLHGRELLYQGKSIWWMWHHLLSFTNGLWKGHWKVTGWYFLVMNCLWFSCVQALLSLSSPFYHSLLFVFHCLYLIWDLINHDCSLVTSCTLSLM